MVPKPKVWLQSFRGQELTKEEICTYLNKILDKEAFDHAELIYGMGHAVYTNSDPRAVILKKFAKQLSEEKGMQKEFALYELVESEAGQLIMNKRKMFKPVCAITLRLCFVIQRL